MNILHICHGYFDSKVYANLFYFLEEQHIDNTIYVSNYRPYSKSISVPNIIITNHKSSLWEKFTYIPRQKALLDEIEKNINLLTIDCIHVHRLFEGGYAAYKLNQKYGIPYIVAIRHSDLDTYIKYMIHTWYITKFILKNAHKIIFISNPHKNRFIKNKFLYNKIFNNKIITIPNGIDGFYLVNKYHQRRSISPNTIKLIYIGDINLNKNLDLVAKSCLILIKQGYHVEYTIIGNIRDSKAGRILYKYDFIKYIPFSPKEDIILHMRQSDIFIMPSHRETFGLVYAEAMSQGLPIIYTRGQGFDGQYQQGEVGFAVSSKSTKEVVNAILHIYNNYNEISNNCIHLCERYNWHNIIDEYINIYNKALTCKEKKSTLS